MGDRLGNLSRMRTSEDKVHRKDFVWVCEDSLCPRKAARCKWTRPRGGGTLHRLGTPRPCRCSCQHFIKEELLLLIFEVLCWKKFRLPILFLKKGVDPVSEAPTRVGSREGNNRSKVLPPQKFCRETASNPGPGDSAS
jgi:hypothetical protein